MIKRENLYHKTFEIKKTTKNLAVIKYLERKQENYKIRFKKKVHFHQKTMKTLLFIKNLKINY